MSIQSVPLNAAYINSSCATYKESEGVQLEAVSLDLQKTNYKSNDINKETEIDDTIDISSKALDLLSNDEAKNKYNVVTDDTMDTYSVNTAKTTSTNSDKQLLKQLQKEITIMQHKGLRAA